MTLTVAPCERKAGQWAVMHWHYSRRMPTGKLITHGVWESHKFVGAVIYGRGANMNMSSRIDETQATAVELVRVALATGRETPTSRVLAASLGLVKASNPDLNAVMSYADMAQGHIGIIYQATNWLYLGSSVDPRIILNGIHYHPRSLSAKYGTRSVKWLRANVDRKARFEADPQPKHLYVYPMNKATRRRLNKQAKPYPKRVKS